MRGRGLFVGVEIKAEAHVDGNHFAKLLMKHGLLTKATHDSTIRLAPPLVITADEVRQSIDIIRTATTELEQRQRVGLPPLTRMARIVFRDESPEKADAAADRTARQILEANADGAVRLIGPMPAAIARIGGFHRRQLELIAPDAPTLQKLLGQLRA